MKEILPCTIAKEVNKATKVARVTYEAQLQQLKTENTPLKVKMDQKEIVLSEYEARSKHIEEKDLKCTCKIEAISLAYDKIVTEHATIEELRVEDNVQLHQMIEEHKAMAVQLESKDTSLKAQALALQANDKEISTLKAMDPFDISKMEVEKATRRITIVLTSLGAIGQEICKPRRVSPTPNLVGGNITVAMMQYGVNITHLEYQSFQILLKNGSHTTKEFIIFMALSQKITLNH